jgi:hypothetical protein
MVHGFVLVVVKGAPFLRLIHGQLVLSSRGT